VKISTEELQADGPPIGGLAAAWDAMHDQVVLTYDDLNALGITYSREHLRRLEAEDRFPLRVRLSPARVVWLLNEVTDWICQRADERRDA
jgi:prophage regulatory protein